MEKSLPPGSKKKGKTQVKEKIDERKRKGGLRGKRLTER